PEVLALRFGMSGGELIGRGVVAPGRSAAPLGGSTPFWEMAVGAAEVSVDAETGAVRVERYVSIADVGRAVNPLLLEGQDEGGAGPFGAKGAGEGSLIPVSPAVANALARLTGVRLRELPLTPERVWRALRGRGPG